MKKAIIILSVVLALLLIVAAILFFTSREPSAQVEPTQVPVTESVLPTEATQAVTGPATTEATETLPEIEVVPDEQVSVLNGFRVETCLIDGERMIELQTFADAIGWDLENKEPQKLFGVDTIECVGDGYGAVINGENIRSMAFSADSKPNGARVYLSFDELIAALGCPEYVDEDTGVHYYTPSARRFEIPQGVNVPVLMYHAVSDEIWSSIGELFVSPSDMEAQLSYIVDNGYDAIWFEDLSHIEDYDKPVILTFDDGYEDNYTELFPLLKKYGVKATIFVIAGAPNNQQHMATEQQIREMSTSGLVSIQSHTYSHPDLDGLGYDDTEYELAQSKKIITRIAGKEPIVLCYPTGKYNDYTLQLGPEYYMFGIKMNGGLYNTSANPFLVNRYYVSRYTDLYSFAAFLSAAGT
ncbi:MAG: polysaccharide deacetylase family protein [Oscillospiraceae bacterium]|nr:polysaccharide deacetylase family protein [Oscillospiraceae bacterium]